MEDREQTYLDQRLAMVAEQLVRRGIDDPQVLAAMQEIPRHRFVATEDIAFAYGDHPVLIGHGQTISQPYIVALMTTRLAVEPGMTVLEIGTGSGYQTAVLAQLGATVYSLEIIEALHDRARITLAGFEFPGRIHLFCGSGYRGLPGRAPFDRIMITCAPPVTPRLLLEQLAPGGVMVTPVGVGPQRLLCIRHQDDGGFEETFLEHVRFVPMVHEV